MTIAIQIGACEPGAVPRPRERRLRTLEANRILAGPTRAWLVEREVDHLAVRLGGRA